MDSLRSDLRSTITSSQLAKAKKKEEAKAAVNSQLDASAAKPNPQVQLTRHLDKFLSKLSFLAPAVKQDIGKYVRTRALQGDRTGSDLAILGEGAARTLAQLEQVLAGKLGIQDVRSEIFARLRDVSRAFVLHPSPAAQRALAQLKRTILRGLQKLRVKLSAAEKKALLNAKISRLERLRQEEEARAARRRALRNDPHLDALSRAASAAVAEAERVAAQETDVQRITSSIRTANNHVNTLTREVARRAHTALDGQGEFSATRAVAPLPQNGAGAVEPL